MKRFFAAALFLVLIFEGSARAHRVNVFAVDEGQSVYTESFLGGKRPVNGGAVCVKNKGGEILLTGFTDQKGVFRFFRPSLGPLDVEVNVGPGHKGVWTLSAVLEKEEGEASGGTKAANGADLAGAMQKMEKKLRFQKIIGALGYIVGFFGVAALLKARSVSGSGR